MAQRKPDERPLEMDAEARERLRDDPRVIVRYRTTTEPYVPKIILKEPADELWLIGRREREWIDDEEWEASESDDRSERS